MDQSNAPTDETRSAEIKVLADAVSRVLPQVEALPFEDAAAALLSVLLNLAVKQGKAANAEAAMCQALIALQVIKGFAADQPANQLH